MDKPIKIKKDTDSSSLSGVYLLLGEEAFLRDYYCNAAVNSLLDKSFADFNYIKYSSRAPKNDEIEDFLSTYPCMSEKKIIVIKDSGLLKKINETDKKFWLETLKDIPDYAVVIFSEESADKRSAVYKEILKNYSVDEFPIQEKSKLVRWVINYCSKNNTAISAEDASYMIDSTSESMYFLKNEADKLCAYASKTKKITKDDINTCCCKPLQRQTFDMIDDCLRKKFKEAGEKLSELKLLKEEPIMINGAVFSKYNQYRKEKILSKTMSAKDIASKIKAAPYFVSKDLSAIKNMSLDDIDKILYLCEETNRKIKFGTGDGWTQIEIIFAEMCR